MKLQLLSKKVDQAINSLVFIGEFVLIKFVNQWLNLKFRLSSEWLTYLAIY